MLRTTFGLIVTFALIAAACVAFGAYFSYVTLQNAHRAAVEARFAVTAERIANTAQFASELGLALPAQTTLADVTQREARLDPAIRFIDVTDAHGLVLYSSDPGRIGRREDGRSAHAVARAVEGNLGNRIGWVTVRYDPMLLEAGARALAADLRAIAAPTLVAAGVATIAIGLLLAASLGRAARRARDPARWPPAARLALAALDESHTHTAPARAATERSAP